MLPELSRLQRHGLLRPLTAVNSNWALSLSFRLVIIYGGDAVPMTASPPIFTEMEKRIPENSLPSNELPDSWWHRVYLAVIITTILVITALGLFSRYFSD